MIKRFNQETGDLGEEIACHYLQGNGYQIRERNFQKRYGEIDIVAQEGSCLVFVEVKTRIGNTFGSPEDSLTPWKINRIIKSAAFYQLTHPNALQSIRIDAVAITLDENKKVKQINLYKNITSYI